MKAILFVPTGEVRIPEAGEYILHDNNVAQALHHEIFAYPILSQHEIEIPEGHNEFHWGSCYGKSVQDLEMPKKYRVIPIHRPKKKVKKWYWYIKGEDCLSAFPYSEEEAQHCLAGLEYYKIPESESEVEE